MSKNISVLILEDEDAASNQLKKELRKIGNLGIHILGELETCRGAISWLEKNLPPDLIFMDIQLSDGPSLDIFDQIIVPSPVIFVTAFDKYALEAFRVNGLDYLLKPIDSIQLKRAIDRYFNLYRSFRVENQFNQLHSVLEKLNTHRYKSAYLVYFKQKIKLIKIAEIAYFHISDNSVCLTSYSGENYRVDDSLEQIEKQLDPALFYRVNRQFLVIKTAIVDLEIAENGKSILNLSPKPAEIVTISRERMRHFKEWATN
ncbi:MAG: response regulator transcription factor [Cyclobacteriaceae bacterium]